MIISCKVHTFVYKYRYLLPKYNSNLANKEEVGNVPGFCGNVLSPIIDLTAFFVRHECD